MGLVLRLVETKADGGTRSIDVLELSRPGNLRDIADLGLMLPEAKRILARVQQAVVAAQARDHAAPRPECPSCGGRCRVKDWRPRQIGEAGTVLLVDDEDAARQPAADRLRDLGHAVLEARDGPEALRILANARPDLLVTDVGLPNGMDGRQLAEAAREGVPGLPVLFISGYAGTSLPPRVEVIDKPFELDVFVRRVRAVLEAGQRRRNRDDGA